MWRLTGPDAARYLNGQVTNDVTGLTDGQACYAAVCTAKAAWKATSRLRFTPGNFISTPIRFCAESLGARWKISHCRRRGLRGCGRFLDSLHVFDGATPPATEAGFVVAHNRFGIPGHDVWEPIRKGLGAVDAPV